MRYWAVGQWGLQEVRLALGPVQLKHVEVMQAFLDPWAGGVHKKVLEEAMGVAFNVGFRNTWAK